MTLTELNEKRKKYDTRIKWGLALLGALIVSPIIFFVVQGLVGLAAAGLTGLLIVNLAPVVSMKLTNWKLKAIKAEAAKNPVETLQNVYNERDKEKLAIKEQITAFRTKCLTFKDKVDGFRVKYPDEAVRFEKQLFAMEAQLARREQTYKQIKADLEKFRDVIDKAQALWDMSLASASLDESAVEIDANVVMQRIKTETALDSIQDSLNRSISSMTSDFLDDDKVIEHVPDMPLLTKLPQLKEVA